MNCGFLPQCVPTTIYCLTKSSILFVLSIDKLNLEKASLKPWREKITDENNDEEELPNKAPEDVDQVLTIGTIGYPNVGKSSLINSLMGKRVVSVSKTPGHTKHFQTIFINSKIRLCDCPGLVFPSKISHNSCFHLFCNLFCNFRSCTSTGSNRLWILPNFSNQRTLFSLIIFSSKNWFA